VADSLEESFDAGSTLRDHYGLPRPTSQFEHTTRQETA
jgi:hypothetical protein